MATRREKPKDINLAEFEAMMKQKLENFVAHAKDNPDYMNTVAWPGDWFEWFACHEGFM